MTPHAKIDVLDADKGEHKMVGPWICTACGKQFGGVSLFDKHRVGRSRDIHPHYGRVCRSSFHLALMGAVSRDGVWREPMSEDKKWWKQRTNATDAL